MKLQPIPAADEQNRYNNAYEEYRKLINGQKEMLAEIEAEEHFRQATIQPQSYLTKRDEIIWKTILVIQAFALGVLVGYLLTK